MKKELPINTIVCGDSLSILRTFPSNSIDMCMTSPPYWGLRDYGVEQIFGGDPECKHDFNVSHRRRNDKSGIHGNMEYIGGVAKSQDGARFGPPTKTCSKCQAWKGQLGLEPTPELYIEHLTEIFREVKRVLKKEGTMWLNIGDTYGSGSGEGGSLLGRDKKQENKIWGNRPIKGFQKCLMMIPERLAWSLIQDGWILRNKIIWYKPNSMPSSVTDRFSNRYEFIYMFSKQQKYYFDLDAVRESHLYKNGKDLTRPKTSQYKDGDRLYQDLTYNKQHELGKNPGDVFEINTQPFPEAHFAVFPEKLCEKPIKAGCPEEVCKKCGKARERMVELGEVVQTFGSDKGKAAKGNHYGDDVGNRKRIFAKQMIAREHKTIGFTSCDCNAGFEGGIVLDPFAGAGTTLYVAKEMKRRYIGIEINKEFCKMCERRVAQGVL